MRIASFNVQNLRLRHIGQGDDARPRLDGARDGDTPEDTGPGARALDAADRRLTAQVIARTDADVICLQEVFDRATLDHFHDEFLRPIARAPWPHRVCLPGNDGRGRDLAVLSRRPLDEVQSHAHLHPADLGLALPRGQRPETPLFRRDCLLVGIGAITLFLCHFKAPYPDPETAWEVRRMEAEAVRRLIEQRFAPAPADHLWLILGDLNEPLTEPTGNRAITPLLAPFSVDLMARVPASERWSYLLPEAPIYSRPDVMLASPALARRWPDARPEILRHGMGREVARHEGPRLPGVGEHRPHASDHAALVIELPGL